MVRGLILMASVISGMVETWQVVVAAIGLLVTVLTVYGAFIKTNYDGVKLLKQRLLGASGDDTDDGFLQRTMDKLDGLGSKMDEHHHQVEQGLQENTRRVRAVENQVERVEYKVDAVAQVVENEHDVLFRGGGGDRDPDARPDGGPPLEDDSDTTRTQS